MSDLTLIYNPRARRNRIARKQLIPVHVLSDLDRPLCACSLPFDECTVVIAMPIAFVLSLPRLCRNCRRVLCSLVCEMPYNDVY